MGIITPQIVCAYGDSDREGWKVVWGPMQNGDIGYPAAQFIGFADRSIQVEGTFGAGGNLAWENSNDGVNFHTANNPFGIRINFVSPDLIEVTECAIFTRPHVSSGDGTTSLVVTCLFRRTKP